MTSPTRRKTPRAATENVSHAPNAPGRTPPTPDVPNDLGLPPSSADVLRAIYDERGGIECFNAADRARAISLVRVIFEVGNGDLTRVGALEALASQLPPKIKWPVGPSLDISKLPKRTVDRLLKAGAEYEKVYYRALKDEATEARTGAATAAIVV